MEWMAFPAKTLRANLPNWKNDYNKFQSRVLYEGGEKKNQIESIEHEEFWWRSDVIQIVFTGRVYTPWHKSVRAVSKVLEGGLREEDCWSPKTSPGFPDLFLPPHRLPDFPHPWTSSKKGPPTTIHVA